ncbi:MAG: hypothetical protein NC548_41080 [Lachnospiraceae bacterium]|nr:hypothetical protein [Lachnospiraceae bacterium]
MTKGDKAFEAQHVEDVQRCYDAVSKCSDLGMALIALTDTIAVTIEHYVKNKTDKAGLMATCIKRLRGFKKDFEK